MSENGNRPKGPIGRSPGYPIGPDRRPEGAGDLLRSPTFLRTLATQAVGLHAGEHEWPTSPEHDWPASLEHGGLLGAAIDTFSPWPIALSDGRHRPEGPHVRSPGLRPGLGVCSYLALKGRSLTFLTPIQGFLLITLHSQGVALGSGITPRWGCLARAQVATAPSCVGGCAFTDGS